MEESKLAAYYDELTKKGAAAAKFKQGLGFSDNDSISAAGDVPIKDSALPSSSSSFLSSFVKSSKANTSDSDIQHQSELHSIKSKLSKKPNSKPRVSDRDDYLESNDRDRDVHSRRRSRSIDRKSRRRTRSRDRKTKRWSRSRSRDSKTRRRSRSRSRDSKSRYQPRSSSRDGERRRRRRSRSRSLSPPRERRSERNVVGVEKEMGGSSNSSRAVKQRNGNLDYARLIQGYDKMSPAERVKAKMKLQLAETAEKDATNGTGSGWERFEFNKDAPLDDEEIEAAEDDAKLVKHIGQSFRFSAVEARKEKQIKAAHDSAMFGAPNNQISIVTNHKAVEDTNIIESNKTDVTSLMSEKVLAKQQGSWRDRVRKM